MRPVCEQKTYHGAVFAATVAAGLPPRLLPPYFGLVFETSQSVRRTVTVKCDRSNEIRN